MLADNLFFFFFFEVTSGPVPESQFCVVYHYKNHFSLSLETPVHNWEPSFGGHLRSLCKVITAPAVQFTTWPAASSGCVMNLVFFIYYLVR